MKRRLFLAATAAALSAPKALFALSSTSDYTPGLIEEKLAAGETVFVDYAADWCGTCKRQERVISELRTNHPEYDENISFVRVDWDTYSGHEVATSRKVPRRSTLILLKGEDELGRIVAGTSTDEIKGLLDLALVKN